MKGGVCGALVERGVCGGIELATCGLRGVDMKHSRCICWVIRPGWYSIKQGGYRLEVLENHRAAPLRSWAVDCCQLHRMLRGGEIGHTVVEEELLDQVDWTTY